MKFRIFSGPDCSLDALSKQFVASGEQRGNPKPLLEIFQYVMQRGCKTVMEEKDYVDNDFLSEYENFYARNFKKISKYCTRLHFFSETITDVKELLALHQEKFAGTYLGFCVLRPTSVFRVGRTVLIPPKSSDDFFVLCKAKFDSFIMGTRFETEAMPFMQQDTSVGACAQACLWMATRYMHKKHLLPRVLPYQITEFATRSISMGSVMPNRKGIFDIQMLEALRLTGLQCVFEKFPGVSGDINQMKEKTLSVKRFLYPYLESELPVILNLEFPQSRIGHAIILVGHTFARNAAPDKYKIQLSGGHVDVFSNVSWIPAFVVHNDNSGPYLQINDISTDCMQISLDKVASAIAALPAEITVFAEEVETNVVATMKVLLEAGIDPAVKLEELVFRTYLRESNTFKKELCDGKREFPDDLKVRYRTLPMPKYIWITEISSKEYMNQSLASERKIFGEFISDSTANPYEKNGAFLAFRFKKFLSTQNLETGEWDFIDLQTESSYAGLARMSAPSMAPA